MNLIENCLLVSPSICLFSFLGYDVLVLISLRKMQYLHHFPYYTGSGYVLPLNEDTPWI